MSIGIASVVDAVASHARATGFFPVVLTHEPKSAPQGPACCITVGTVVPFRERSGLASMSVAVTLLVRLYANMLQEPQDAIDRDLIIAADALMTAYAGDIELGGTGREVDLFGMAVTAGTSGQGMNARLGYINQDNKHFRVADIQLPIIINDVWTEAR